MKENKNTIYYYHTHICASVDFFFYYSKIVIDMYNPNAFLLIVILSTLNIYIV